MGDLEDRDDSCAGLLLLVVDQKERVLLDLLTIVPFYLLLEESREKKWLILVKALRIVNLGPALKYASKLSSRLRALFPSLGRGVQVGLLAVCLAVMGFILAAALQTSTRFSILSEEAQTE